MKSRKFAVSLFEFFSFYDSQTKDGMLLDKRKDIHNIVKAQELKHGVLLDRRTKRQISI